MKWTLLVISSFAISMVASAAPTEKNRVRISDSESSDSAVVIDGISPLRIGTLCFSLIKLNSRPELWDYVWQPIRGSEFSRKVYLKFGPGEYTLRVSVSKNPKVCEDVTDLAEFKVNNLDRRDLSFLLPSPAAQSDDPAIVQLASELTSTAKNMREKSRVIYDWVARQIRYDHSFTLPTDATNTFLNRSSICAGYAALNAALHRAVGIRARIITGLAHPFGLKNASSHAWNEVLIDGEWIVEDPTWENGSVEYPTRTPGIYTRSWFDPSPRAMELTHIKERVSRD